MRAIEQGSQNNLRLYLLEYQICDIEYVEGYKEDAITALELVACPEESENHEHDRSHNCHQEVDI